MPQCCAVPFCSERKGGHVFPKDKTVLKQWLVAIRRSNYTPTQHSRVCKKHFNPEDYMLPKESYTDNPTPRLKPKVVPSKFSWNQESEDLKEIKRKRAERAHQRQTKKLETGTLSSNTEETQHEKHFTFEETYEEIKIEIKDVSLRCSLCKREENLSYIANLSISDSDHICEACWEIANKAINDGSGLEHSGTHVADSTPKGHRLVCIICGLSLLTRQNHLILRENASDLARNMADIIGDIILPRQVTSADRICHPCWMKTKRSALRVQQAEEAKSSVPEVANYPEIKIETDLDQDPLQNINVEEIMCPEFPDPVKRDICLPNYRRAANTASHCLFPGCSNTHLHTMSDSLRASVLSNNNYYIPMLARICKEHLHCNNWDSLYYSTNSINTFTVQQIQHVFSFVRSEGRNKL